MFQSDYYKIFITLKNCNHSTIACDLSDIYEAILQYSLEQLLNRGIISVKEKIYFEKMFTHCNTSQISAITNIEEISIMAAKL